MAGTLGRFTAITIMALALVGCGSDGSDDAAGGGDAQSPTTRPQTPDMDPAPETGGAGQETVPSSRSLGGLEFKGLQTPKSLVSNGGTYYVVINVEPNPLRLNELFTMTVRVASDSARSDILDVDEIAVDGRMPAHRHGMNRVPSIEKNADGTFTVSGMLFHMPGDWEIYIDITRAGVTERAQTALTLE